jgi:GT2 family glycosyltransferase
VGVNRFFAKKLSICLVTYNAREETLACLRSLYAHPPKGAWEVILADNG